VFIFNTAHFQSENKLKDIVIFSFSFLIRLFLTILSSLFRSCRFVFCPGTKASKADSRILHSMYSYIGTHTGRQVTSKAKQSTCQDAEPPFLHPRKPFASRPQTRHLLCARTVHSKTSYAWVCCLDLQETAIAAVCHCSSPEIPSEGPWLHRRLCAHRSFLKPAESRCQRSVPNHGDGPALLLHFRAHRAAANQDAKQPAERPCLPSAHWRPETNAWTCIAVRGPP
jgi:hypothetical protein